MAKALRTIPVILGIARDMRELAPGALLVNFTNPAGLVTEALARYAPDVPSVGVCNVSITTKMHLLERWENAKWRDRRPRAGATQHAWPQPPHWHRGFTDRRRGCVAADRRQLRSASCATRAGSRMGAAR